MTLISSGALGLKDAGTNSSSSTRLSTTISVGGMTSAGYQVSRRLQYEQGFSYYLYSADKIFDGTMYGYGNATDRTMKDTNPTSTVPFGNLAGMTNAIDYGLQSSSYAPQYYSTFGQQLGWEMGVGNTTGVGSIGANTFTDDNANSQTIRDILWLENTGVTGNNGNLLVFSLDGAQVNSNDTFVSITINGNTFTRSSATHVLQYNNATWYWHPTDSQCSSMGTSGSKSFTVNGNTVTLNNGIWEEMGQNPTDSNPINIQHYYKGGPQHNTPGIPTSGQIRFSDFYGKSFIANSTDFSFTGGSHTYGKVGSEHGYNEGLGPTGSNLSPTQDSVAGATLSPYVFSCSGPGGGFGWFSDIISGTVSTTSWTTLTISRSGYTSLNFSRSSATTNSVSSGKYYVSWTSAAHGHNVSSLQTMLASGTITVEIS